MNTNILTTILFALAVIFSSVKGTDQEGGDYEIQPVNISLIVLGRSGSGISSTVRQLLGPNKTTIKPNGTYHSLIEVYEVPLPSGGVFKIADVDGLVDGRSMDQDVQVLSSLKSYLQGPLEQVHEICFLVISKFDDSRFYGKYSIFTKMLRRIQILQEELYGNANLNTVLLLTRLMSETVSQQRKPRNKMDQFRSVIRNFTSFAADSVEIVVGENFPEGYGLVVENGQTNLPNKQLYPQNVFDAFLKIARSLNNSAVAGALTEFMNNRNHQENILLHPYPQSKSMHSNTSNSLFTKVYWSDSEINQTEIDTTLSNAFDSLNESTNTEEILSFIELQQFLQSKGFTTVNNLPNNTLDTTDFFKTVPKNSFQRSLLSAAFNLTEIDLIEKNQPPKSIFNDTDNTLIQSAASQIKLDTALKLAYEKFFASTRAKANSTFVKLNLFSQSNNLTTLKDLTNYFLGPVESLTFSKDELFLVKEFFQDLKLNSIGLNADNSALAETQMEINSIAFDSFCQTKASSSLKVLQEYFQSMNLTTVNNLPKTTVEKVKFFQTVPKDRFQLSLLSEVFKPPEFVAHPVVGYGFDVTMDESLMTTPFVENKLNPNSIGYLLPSFISCDCTREPIEFNIAFYNERKVQSIKRRLQMFNYEKNETVRYFEGKIKPGFNFKPPTADESLQTLSTVKEIRTIKCELVQESIELNEEFINRVNELGLYDSSDRYSVNEWKAFFNKYGTHVVSSGYGGGKIDGLLSRQNSFKNETQIKNTLNSVVNFGNFTLPNVPIYRFFGAINDIPLDGKYNLTRWENGLRLDPIMLEYELSLTPISKFVASFNTTLGDEVERCTELFLSGNLDYKRINRVTTSSTTAEPQILPSSTIPGAYFKTESQSGNGILTENEAHTSKNPTATNTTAETSSKINKSSARNKTADYTNNTVGQGYNILTGVVLPKSPFELGNINEIKISQIDNFYRLGNKTKICFGNDVIKMKKEVYGEILLAPQALTDVTDYYISESAYKMDKIHKWSGHLSDIVEVPNGFVDEIPTWISIQNQRQTKQAEYRLVQLHLTKEIISKEFLKRVQDLHYQSISPWPCYVKEAWKDFFETYGTHYIKSAYAGQFEIIPENEETKCQPRAYCCDEGIYVLKSSFVFEKLGLVLFKNPNVKKDLDEAYYQLLKNNLEC